MQKIDLSKKYNEVYLELKRRYPNAVISPSFVRSEQVLRNSRQSYKFEILRVGDEVSTEQKIDKNDLFVAVTAKLGYYARSVERQDEGLRTLSHGNPSYSTLSIFDLQALTSDEVTAISNFDGRDVHTIFNGKMHIKKGTRVVVENFPLRNFLELGEGNSSQYYYDVFGNNANDSVGVYPLTPILELPGREQVEIKLEAPTFNAIAWEYPLPKRGEIRLALVFDGFVVKGAKSK